MLEDRIRYGAHILIQELDSLGNVVDQFEDRTLVLRASLDRKVLAWHSMGTEGNYHGFWIENYQLEGDTTVAWVRDFPYRFLIMPLNYARSSAEYRIIQRYQKLPDERRRAIEETVVETIIAMQKAGFPELIKQGHGKTYEIISEWNWRQTEEGWEPVINAVWAANENEIDVVFPEWLDNTDRQSLIERRDAVRSNLTDPLEALDYWFENASVYHQVIRHYPITAATAQSAARSMLIKLSEQAYAV